jgi:hypothetical protein
MVLGYRGHLIERGEVRSVGKGLDAQKELSKESESLWEFASVKSYISRQLVHTIKQVT